MTNQFSDFRNTISIREEIKPGDAGYITYMHGRLYALERGYSSAFEAYVAESFYRFLLHFDPEKDRLWCAESEGKIVGCIGIAQNGTRAQLRWFLLEPEVRHMGLGRELLSRALAFAKNAGYASVYLDTTSDLTEAISLYEKAGFREVGRKPNDSWKENTLELEYELTFTSCCRS